VHAVRLLAAAPYQLLARISQVTTVAPRGLVAQIRGGPSIYFGDPQELSSKWIAASAVLADPGSAGAVYIDVTDPQRPVAGAGSDQATAASGAASTVGGGSSSSQAAPTASGSPATSPSPGIAAPASQPASAGAGPSTSQTTTPTGG
jgi:hypothetical protein